MKKIVLGLVGALASVFAANAYAYDPTIIVGRASTNLAHVVIVTCNEGNPYRCPIEFEGPMSSGQEFKSFTGTLCYRRENRPGDASSALGGSWSCVHRTISGSENFEIH